MKPLAPALLLLVVAALLPGAHAQTGLLPPQDLHGHYDAQTHALSLSWAPPLDAVPGTEYNVYQDGNLLATVTGSAYTDTLAPTGTESAFSVTAITNGQESAPAYTVFLFNGQTDICDPIGILPENFPNVVVVDTDCLWSILHFPP